MKLLSFLKLVPKWNSKMNTSVMADLSLEGDIVSQSSLASEVQGSEKMKIPSWSVSVTEAGKKTLKYSILEAEHSEVSDQVMFY